MTVNARAATLSEDSGYCRASGLLELRIHDICVAFERTRDQRLITLARPNRPEIMAPHVNVSDIETCFADDLDGENAREWRRT